MMMMWCVSRRRTPFLLGTPFENYCDTIVANELLRLQNLSKTPIIRYENLLLFHNGNSKIQSLNNHKFPLIITQFKILLVCYVCRPSNYYYSIYLGFYFRIRLLSRKKINKFQTTTRQLPANYFYTSMSFYKKYIIYYIALLNIPF